MVFTPEIHDHIFNYLYDWCKIASQNDELNPFFATRQRRDKSFDQGYLFPGGKDTLILTFWTGSDTKNRTPNIYLELNSKSGIRACLIGRDSEYKAKYFEDLAKVLNFKKGKLKGTFIKNYNLPIENYIEAIAGFIFNDKIEIDHFIETSMIDYDVEDGSFFIDEYSSKFGFISKSQFEQMTSRVKEYQNKIDITPTTTTTTKSPHNLSTKNLKLSINSIKIENYHEIKFSELEKLPNDTNWIFLTGENGFGKTSVLQAICLGLTNLRNNISRFNEKTAIQIGFNLENIFHVNSNLNYQSKLDFKEVNSFIVAYGPSRLNTLSIDTQNEDKEDSNIAGIFNTSSRLKNFEYELLIAKSFNKNKYFEMLCNAIEVATGSFISDIKVGDNAEITFVEKLKDGKSLPLTIDKLSAGYRNIINIVGDIIVRLYDKKSQKNLSDIYGIVLIDEIENHLHPKMQKALPILLSNVFPNIQFIASTHSPIPLLGAPKNSIIINVNRSSTDGILLRRFDEKIYLQDFQPNALLSSPIFGMEDIFHFEINKSIMPSIDETYREKIYREELSNNVDEFLNNKTEKKLIELMKKRKSK